MVSHQPRFTLAFADVRHECLTMKSVSVREFYHNSTLVDGLGEGKQLVVTKKGKPNFVVTKGVRPKMTRALAEARAVGDAKAPKIDSLKVILALKK
jgi:antitoxin (DNA-binding transcriptional repressor) of toxin-antitoxin stability system